MMDTSKVTQEQALQVLNSFSPVIEVAAEVRLMTRRLLGEQIAVVVVLESGKKDDAMWHVPQ